MSQKPGAAPARATATGGLAPISPLSKTSFEVALYRVTSEEFSGEIEELTADYVQVRYKKYRSKKYMVSRFPISATLGIYGEAGGAGTVVIPARRVSYHTVTGRVQSLANGQWRVVPDDGTNALIYDPHPQQSETSTEVDGDDEEASTPRPAAKPAPAAAAKPAPAAAAKPAPAAAAKPAPGRPAPAAAKPGARPAAPGRKPSADSEW